MLVGRLPVRGQHDKSIRGDDEVYAILRLSHRPSVAVLGSQSTPAAWYLMKIGISLIERASNRTWQLISNTVVAQSLGTTYAMLATYNSAVQAVEMSRNCSMS